MLLSFVTTSAGHDAITTSLAFVLLFVNPFVYISLRTTGRCVVYFLFGFVVVLFVSCCSMFEMFYKVFVFFLSANFSAFDWLDDNWNCFSTTTVNPAPFHALLRGSFSWWRNSSKIFFLNQTSNWSKIKGGREEEELTFELRLIITNHTTS